MRWWVPHIHTAHSTKAGCERIQDVPAFRGQALGAIGVKAILLRIQNMARMMNDRINVKDPNEEDKLHNSI